MTEQAVPYGATPEVDRATELAKVCGTSPLPSNWQALMTQLDRVRMLEQQRATVRALVMTYYHALDRRQHGAAAAFRALQAIEKTLGMEWVQGGTLPMSVLNPETPPVGFCPSCHRKTWALEDLGAFCDLSQPSGGRCAGVMTRR